jgi:hypothetical protein
MMKLINFFVLRQFSTIFAAVNTEGVAQLVRATVCGTVGRGFETHHSPLKPCKNVTRFFF